MTGLRKPALPTLIDAEPDWFDLVDFLGGVTTDTQIDATKILLAQGGSLLSTWRHASDLSKIDAAKLLGDIASARMQANVLAAIIAAGGIVDADIAAAAAIAQSKLALAITNTQVAAAAGIVSSKLAAWPSQAEADRLLAGYEANPKNHSATKITSDILAAARGGHGKTVDLTSLADKDVLKYDLTNDKFVRLAESGYRDAVKLQTRDIYSGAPADGQYLKWVAANSRWEPASM